MGLRVGQRLTIAALTLFGVVLSGTIASGDSDRVPLAAQPAPPGLAPWTDQSGDYFDAVQFPPVGALTWSRWPVRVSIDPTAPPDWQADVRAALDNWQTYVPLTIVPDSEAITPDGLATFETSETQEIDALAVDIAIVRTVVPSQPDRHGQLRAASARATFSLFVVRDRSEYGVDRERFGHRFVIRVSPTQAGVFVRSAVRHEFGHALGIWGHSPNPEDVMFAAQVAQPGSVSARDLNTLMRVYEQPTRLGWWVESQEMP
jgi:predicted Zn-dependent protease